MMIFDERSAAELTMLLKRSADGDVDAGSRVGEQLADATGKFLDGLDRPFALTDEHRRQARQFVDGAFERFVECDPSATTMKVEFYAAVLRALRREILARSKAR